jgi:hypothetical protein
VKPLIPSSSLGLILPGKVELNRSRFENAASAGENSFGVGEFSGLLSGRVLWYYNAEARLTEDYLLQRSITTCTEQANQRPGS